MQTVNIEEGAFLPVDEKANHARFLIGLDPCGRRPRKLSAGQVSHARELLKSGKETRGSVAALFKVDVATLRRALQRDGAKPGGRGRSAA